MERPGMWILCQKGLRQWKKKEKYSIKCTLSDTFEPSWLQNWSFSVVLSGFLMLFLAPFQPLCVSWSHQHAVLLLWKQTCCVPCQTWHSLIRISRIMPLERQNPKSGTENPSPGAWIPPKPPWIRKHWRVMKNVTIWLDWLILDGKPFPARGGRVRGGEKLRVTGTLT